VTAVAGDVNDPAALAKVLAGHDAVISAVPFRNTNPDVLIGAVRASGVKRYIIVGGAASLLNAEGVRLLDTPALARFKESPEPAGGAVFLERIRTVTDLDWSFFSPAVNFAPGQRTGKFRLGGDTVVVDAAGQSRISMEDYAVALVDELENPTHIRQRFTAGY
jgi:putative NADH-flavin reductase